MLCIEGKKIFLSREINAFILLLLKTLVQEGGRQNHNGQEVRGKMASFNMSAYRNPTYKKDWLLDGQQKTVGKMTQGVTQ